MIRITPKQVTPLIRSFFSIDDMVATRCFVTLEGSSGAGKIIIDDMTSPKWAVVQEGVDNTLYWGGRIDLPTFTQVFTTLRTEGDVLVGLKPDDPRIEYLPDDADNHGIALEFHDRPVGEMLDTILSHLPLDYSITRLDRKLIMRTEWGPKDVMFYGGIDSWERRCFGYCLMRGDQILSEATVGPSAMGLFEPGVYTQVGQRGKGFATMVVARLIQEIEANHEKTYWNCDEGNIASIRVAKKLGYQTEKKYRYKFWKKSG